MWRKGKKRAGEESAAGDSEGARKFAKGDPDDESIVICELSKNRKVSVRSWQGKIVVDIREFYVKDGKEFPGKKGISLNMEQWSVLRENIEDISEAVAENS